MNKRKFSTILCLILILTLCGVSSVSIAADPAEVELPQNLSLKFDLDALPKITQAYAYTVSSLYFDPTQAADLLLSDSQYQTEFWGSGTSFHSSDNQEYLVLTEAGTKTWDNQSSEGVDYYALSYDLAIEANPQLKFLLNQANRFFNPYQSAQLSFSDQPAFKADAEPAFQSMDVVTEEAEALLSNFSDIEIQIVDHLPVTASILNEQYDWESNQLHSMSLDGESPSEVLTFTVDDEAWFLKGAQVIDDIPIINLGSLSLPDSTIDTSGATPLAIVAGASHVDISSLDLVYTSDGVAQVVLDHLYTQPAKTEAHDLLSFEEALDFYLADASNQLIVLKQEITDAELFYLPVPAEDEGTYVLRPAWVFFLRRYKPNCPFEEYQDLGDFIQYRSDAVDAISGEIYRGDRW